MSGRNYLLSIVVSCLAWWVAASGAQTIYKYQTEDGRWHFADKPPNGEASHRDTLQMKSRGPLRESPEVRVERSGDGVAIVARNPWAGPVEVLVEVRTDDYRYLRKELPAQSKEILQTYPGGTAVDTEFYMVSGPRLDQPPQPQVYSPPFAAGTRHRISQGFNGAFSHNRQPSLYALDIAMPLGTHIHAARDGVVMAVEDDYVIGSVSSAYFYDKANYVMVLHADGTTAIYAHVLQGSVQVEPGQQVERGQALARSGNSGFSNGPHLHFAIRMNARGELISIPFQVVDAEGREFSLNRGDVLTSW